MKRITHGLLIAALALAGTLNGQTRPVTETSTQNAGNPAVAVFVTAKGKTYHTHRDCIALSRSKGVLTASEADAQQHGLRLCGICAHRHHAGTVKDNSSWAKGAK